MEKYILEVSNLTKKYDKVTAVDNISFKIKNGSFFAFLGQNGAGKSTTINAISTILKKDFGTIKINNLDIEKNTNKVKKIFGVVFQNNLLDENLTIKENLFLKGALYIKDKNILLKNYNEVISLLNLKDIESRLFKNLSGGQKRKSEIASTLISKPKLLILDEPTTGLDPKSRREVWDILTTLRKKEDLTIFLTTHYMEEANQADKIVIINKGKIVANDSPLNLKRKYTKDKLFLYPKNKKDLILKLKNNNIDFIKENNHIEIFSSDKDKLIEIINLCKNLIKSFELIKGSMDDVFLNITKEELK